MIFGDKKNGQISHKITDSIEQCYCNAIMCGQYEACVELVYFYVDILHNLDTARHLCCEFNQYIMENSKSKNFNDGFKTIRILNDLQALHKYIYVLIIHIYNANNPFHMLINY